MKKIIISVPDGVYEMTRSIAASHDIDIKDVAAHGLVNTIHAEMQQKLGIETVAEGETPIELVPSEKVVLNITPELHRLLVECARVEEEVSVSDWVISNLESILIMFAEQYPVAFTDDEVRRLYEH